MKKKTIRHPLANIWYAMKQRCYNPKNPNYKMWGGRGIKMCDRWKESFANFVLDMGVRPSDSHQIDRINNDSDYTPENCRWSTKSEQARNRRYNVKDIGVYKHAKFNGWQVYSGSKYIGLFRDYEKALVERKKWP